MHHNNYCLIKTGLVRIKQRIIFHRGKNEQKDSNRAVLCRKRAFKSHKY